MKKLDLEAEIKNNPFLNLGDLIFDSMYRDIIQLRIIPGTKLVESRIAEDLNISRTPVKYALNKLSDLGLVNKGTGKVLIVSRMSAEEGSKVYEARKALEGFAAYLAVTNMTPQQLARLNDLNEQYYQICNSENFDRNAHAECDDELHRLIITCTNNDYILSMYDQLERGLLHYRYSLMAEHDDETLRPIVIKAAQCHKALSNAFNLGFAETARSLVERDIDGMKDAFRYWTL